MSVTIELMGGLGNQLFQLAFLDYVSKSNEVIPLVTSKNITSKHSTLNYFDSIFKNWNNIQTNTQCNILLQENSYKYQEWNLDKSVNIRICGYFQNYRYISPDFVSNLNFSDLILSKYPEIGNSVFLHVRGGDYLHPDHSWLHNVVTDTYYQQAISEFPENTKFVVFTNDKGYALSKSFISKINYQFIDENEIDSLYLMSKCAGGICANSTFSWWGAYLNPNRKLILPSKWFTDPNVYINGYFFDGCTVINI